MPLIDTSTMIHEIVRESLQVTEKEKKSVTEKLDESFLTIPSLLESLRGIVDTGQSDAVRLSAIKTALEMHNLLNTKGDPGSHTVTININGSGNTQINPILIPRELT